MSKIKGFIKKYKITITVFAIVICIAVGIILYNYIGGLKIYHDPSLEGGVDTYEIKQLDANEYEIANVDESDIFEQYYKEFMSLLVNNPSEAWKLLTDSNKDLRYHGEYSKFLEDIKLFASTSRMNAGIDRYSYSESGHKVIVIDKSNYSYSFYEDGVWNYKVSINGQVAS